MMGAVAVRANVLARPATRVGAAAHVEVGADRIRVGLGRLALLAMVVSMQRSRCDAERVTNQELSLEVAVDGSPAEEVTLLHLRDAVSMEQHVVLKDSVPVIVVREKMELHYVLLKCELESEAFFDAGGCGGVGGEDGEVRLEGDDEAGEAGIVLSRTRCGLDAKHAGRFGYLQLLIRAVPETRVEFEDVVGMEAETHHLQQQLLLDSWKKREDCPTLLWSGRSTEGRNGGGSWDCRCLWPNLGGGNKCEDCCEQPPKVVV